jgi:ribosomal protein S18
MMDLKNRNKVTKDNYYLLFTENVDYQKVEICKEFMNDYTKLFIDSFLGLDAFENQEEINNYIKWCFNKTSEEYKKIYNFDFSKQEKLLTYFTTYSNEIISKDVDLNKLLVNLKKLINERFNLYNNKNEKEIKDFLNLYFLFFVKKP